MRYRTCMAAIAIIVISVGLAACGGGGSHQLEGTSLKTLSNRADLISGGSALVEVTVPAAAETGELRVDVDCVDVTSSVTNVGRRMICLIKKLEVRAHNVHATA